MIKHVSKALLFASLIFPMAAHADVLLEGHHVVARTVQIENVSDFPAYDFYLATNFKFPGTEKVDSDAPVVVYGGWVGLFAVKKEDASSIKKDESDSETAGSWYKLKENSALILWSELTLSLGDHQLPDTNSTVSERFVIRIDGMSDGKVAAHLVRTERQNARGEYVVEKGTMPSTDTEQTKTTLPAAAIPVVVGLLGLAVGFGIRSAWKK